MSYLHTVHNTGAQMHTIRMIEGQSLFNKLFCLVNSVVQAVTRTSCAYSHDAYCVQLAAVSGDVRIAELLLKHRADVDARDLYGGSALHTASHLDNQAVVEVLLDHKADVNAYDNEGWTPLHLAAEAGHSSMVKYLISRHANVNAQSKYGRTPLHWACTAGHLAVVNELLSAKANANILDHHDNPAYHYATKDTIRTLVKIHTTKPELNKQFSSTIGLHIASLQNSESAIDVKQSRDAAKQRKWRSADDLDHSSSLTEKELEVIRKHHRNRERCSSYTVSDTSSSLRSKFDSVEGDDVGNSFKELVSNANQEILSLTDTFRDFYSIMALASDSSIQLSQQTLDSAVVKLSAVQGVLEDFMQSFRLQSEDFLYVLKEERVKSVSSQASPSFVALVTLFIESLLNTLGAHDNHDIWRTFLSKLELSENVKALLTIRLQFDTEISLRDKLKHCIMFWARSFDMTAPALSGFSCSQTKLDLVDVKLMKALLLCVHACDEAATADAPSRDSIEDSKCESTRSSAAGVSTMVADTLLEFVQENQEFKTGKIALHNLYV